MFIVPDSDVASVLQVRCVGIRDVGRPPRAAVRPLSASLASSQSHARPALEAQGRLVALQPHARPALVNNRCNICADGNACADGRAYPAHLGVILLWSDPPLAQPPPCRLPCWASTCGSTPSLPSRSGECASSPWRQMPSIPRRGRYLAPTHPAAGQLLLRLLPRSWAVV